MAALLALTAWQQKESSPPQEIQAKVVSASNSLPLESVHVINLNTIVGAISDREGTFTIPAQVGDTLYITYLGFKSEKIRVSNDFILLENSSIALTELAYALEEVVVRPYQLTGYLEIDIKYLPISTAFQYSISGLNRSYEARNSRSSDARKLLGSLMNPIESIGSLFKKKGLQLQKLPSIKQDENIRSLLATKFDRETLTALLQINRDDMEKLLNQCNYSEGFVQSANDLQILDALNLCYEEFKVLNRD
ncbi:MAG: carboxypeptidase-like regulatory domain-containing protein [Bacteroidetes bacterium]|nr:carboxypeptidase-like regulatory domain-containing protein [Bacteroidota bacterium]